MRSGILVWLLVCAAVKVVGQGFQRPQCNLKGTSACVHFDPDPDPEPFDVIDKLGRKVPNPNAPGPIGPAPPRVPNTDDPTIDIVAKTVDIPKEEEGVFRVRAMKLERYFPKMDIGQVEQQYEGTDLEIIEWPGIVSDTDAVPNGVSYEGRLQRKFGEKFAPLSFRGEHSIFRHYVCNRRLGTHIRAMGFKPINPNYTLTQEYNPFYLAFGPRSFHRDFIQPLFAPVKQMNRLAEGHTDPNCLALQVPANGSDILVPSSSRLNHILDFTFASNRLILGMYCGIMILKPIDAPTNYLEAAKRNPDPDDYSEDDLILDTFSKYIKKPIHKNIKFIGKINRVSSNVCCAGVCNEMEPIAVAYSYDIKNTEENLKRIYLSFDNGDSWDQKLVAASDTTFLKLINGLYTRQNLKPPEFVSRRIVKAKATGRWGNDTDHVVRAILDGTEEKEAPTVLPGQVICAEIVSVEVIQEEKGFLALCRTDLGDPLQRRHPQGVQLNINYAVFQFDVSKNSPLLHGKLKSKRRLSCTVKDSDLEPNVEIPREPEIRLSTRGMNLIIIGCESILYHSVNGGYTFWNAVFYTASDEGYYERRFQQPGFSIPSVAFDPDGNSVTFTFGDFYAVGFMAYTEEFRLLVGRIAETEGRIDYRGVCAPGQSAQQVCNACKNTALKEPGCVEVKEKCLEGSSDPECTPYVDTFIKFSTNRKFIPYYTNSGDIKFAVSVMHFLLENNNTHTAKYENRKAIRLIDIPFKLTDAIRPFFEENTAIANKQDGFSKCRTFAFSVDTRERSIDLGETAVFTVSVQDKNADAELGIFSSLPQVLKIDVVKNNSISKGALNLERTHVWRVSVTPRGILKDSLRLYEDTFFGSNYDMFSYQSANLVLTNAPAERCHTQPRGNVLVNLGCSGKKLVAHEDYDRPQCQKFFGLWDFTENAYQTYNFRLEDGQYDPELLSFWRKRDPKLFSRDGDGWVVEYDYKTFGCPIEPYRLDPFHPDLRVLNLKESSNITDTARGKPFLGQYVLIEAFGQGGFSFLKTVKESGCRRAPLKFKTLLRDWKNRRKVIFEAFKKYKSFHTEAVADPQNIWQKSSHLPCEIPARRAAEDVEDLRIPEDDPYEIMQRGSGNAIVWDRKERKDVYFFLAIDIDRQIDTFCDYTTFFAVSLNADIRSDPLYSIVRFLVMLFFICCLIILGYYAHRMYSTRVYAHNALYARLERGAWEILLRYEKYLHEVEMHGNERVRIVDNVPTLILPSAQPKPRRSTQGKSDQPKKMAQGTAPKMSRMPDPKRFARAFSKQFQ